MISMFLFELQKKYYAFISKARSAIIRKLFYSCGQHVLFGRIGELHGSKAITIGDNTCFGDGLFLCAWPFDNRTISKSTLITIGNNCNFGAMNHITCSNQIIIGNNVLTGKWVTITDNSHGATDAITLKTPPLKRELISKGKVVIMDNVWIGDGVRILPGVTIGSGAVIGANSVVTKDIQPYCVACGVPAKEI